MIVLDTKIISELWKIAPHPSVLTWMDAQAVETLYLTAVTVAELRYGLATIPKGKRRALYQERLEQSVLPVFAGRVLPFDLAASASYAELMARARARGKAMMGHLRQADGYIAAIAAAHGLKVATRDIRPFEVAGIATIDPWQASP